MIAAEKADVWAVKRLLRAGAGAKVLNFRKQSAIHSALKPKPSVGVVEIVRALIDAGTPLLGTELHFPVYQRDVEMTRLLLDRGCPLNVPFTYNEYAGPKKGETPLTSAVRSQPIDTTDAPEIGLTPTEPQRLEIARLLLTAGVDPNLPGAKGWTPLMIAVAEKHLELARMLLKAGADPRRVPPNVKIESPAALAAKKGLAEFVQCSPSTVRYGAVHAPTRTHCRYPRDRTTDRVPDRIRGQRAHAHRGPSASSSGGSSGKDWPADF